MAVAKIIQPRIPSHVALELDHAEATAIVTLCGKLHIGHQQRLGIDGSAKSRVYQALREAGYHCAGQAQHSIGILEES